jgi:peptidoglycan hydrolase CwlO-like protein
MMMLQQLLSKYKLSLTIVFATVFNIFVFSYWLPKTQEIQKLSAIESEKQLLQEKINSIESLLQSISTKLDENLTKIELLEIRYGVEEILSTLEQ